MRLPFSPEMLLSGLELAVHRSEAQVRHLRLTGVGGIDLREAEEELESAVENLAEFFDFTRDLYQPPVGSNRSGAVAFSLESFLTV